MPRHGPRFPFSLLFFFLLLPAPAFAAVGTQSQARGVFLRHYEAIGGLARLKSLSSTYSEGLAWYDGLQGRFRLWEEKPLSFRLEEDFGVISQVSGDDGEQAWSLDTNGQVEIFRDRETAQRRELKRRLEDFEHLDPASRIFSLSFQGTRKIGGRRHLVVAMKNSINSDESRYFFDSRRFYLRRHVLRLPDVTVSTDFADFRRVKGFVVPFRERSKISPRGKRTATRLTRFVPGAVMAPELRRLPPPARDIRVDGGAAGVTVPFVTSGGKIFLPVSLAGDSRLWLLDSGASMSIIDAGLARQMGMLRQGTIRGFGFGKTFELGFARLPGLDVGGVHAGPQTVFAYEGLSARFSDPPAVGILGYDFLSRLVSRIDYANKTVTFFPPAGFHYDGPGQVFDAPLKYRTFTLPVVVDGVHAGMWSLDIGAENSSFFFPYAKKHGFLERIGENRQSHGLAGAAMEKTIQAESLAIGRFIVAAPSLAVPLAPGPGSTAIGEQAGNLGASVLGRFVVWLDYERQQVALEENSGARPR